MELVSLILRLEQQLQSIENQVIQLLDASTIEKHYQDPFSEVVFIASDDYWGKPDEMFLTMNVGPTYPIFDTLPGTQVV